MRKLSCGCFVGRLSRADALELRATLSGRETGPAPARRFFGAMLIIAAAIATRSLALEPEPTSPESAPAPSLAVSISTGIEEGREMLIATAKSGGKPVPDVKVKFLIERSFGRLPIGEEATLDDGTAAVPFPKDLPGGPGGELSVVIEAETSPDSPPVAIRQLMRGGLVTEPETEPFKRALWTPQAPLPLVLTVIALLSIVWATYGFVIVNLVQIKKAGKNA